MLIREGVSVKTPTSLHDGKGLFASNLSLIASWLWILESAIRIGKQEENRILCLPRQAHILSSYRLAFMDITFISGLANHAIGELTQRFLGNTGFSWISCYLSSPRKLGNIHKLGWACEWWSVFNCSKKTERKTLEIRLLTHPGTVGEHEIRLKLSHYKSFGFHAITWIPFSFPSNSISKLSHSRGLVMVIIWTPLSFPYLWALQYFPSHKRPKVTGKK